MKMKNKRTEQIAAKKKHKEKVKSKRKEEPNFDRPAPKLIKKPTILIVCEGQTEELYFKSFLVSTLTVKLFSLGQSKLQLVENTERIQQIEQCDEVWCVFDLDIKLDVANCIPDFDNSIAKAKELGAKFDRRKPAELEVAEASNNGDDKD